MERVIREKATWSGLKKWGMGVIAGLALLAAWGCWEVWRDLTAMARFAELANEGSGAPSLVERGIDVGGGHLGPGEKVRYGDRFPTSGQHDPQWLDPGMYKSPQPAARLIHSLERGMIVIYIDTPPDDVVAMLESWTELFGGPWSGVLVVPALGLGKNTVVLTAWNRTLRLEPFEPVAAAAFIDRYSGRGPENQVRY